MPRLTTQPRPSASCLPALRTDFFREELLKHRRCLERQREFYSEGAISQADAALARVIGRIDQLCASDNAEEIVSSLLRKFDVVTGLSWSEPGKLH
jgi:hypothetical protein